VGGEGAPVSASNVLFCMDSKEKAEIIEKMGGFVGAIDRSWTALREATPPLSPVEQIWRMKDSQGQILALASR